VKTKLVIIPTGRLPGLPLEASCRKSFRQVDMQEWLVLKVPMPFRSASTRDETGPKCAWEVTRVAQRIDHDRIAIYAFQFCAPLDLEARKNLDNHRELSYRRLIEAARRCHKEQEVEGILTLMALRGRP